MGLLTDILSRIDAMKRRGAGLLANPSELFSETGFGPEFGGTQSLGYRTREQMGLLGSVFPEVQQMGRDEFKRDQGLLNQAMTDVAIAGIVPPPVARSLNVAHKLPDSPVFAEAVANTPGASIADDGLLMRVQRNQLPEQGLQESVRGGVFYLPEGAAQAKHYSTGKNGYGGPERIAGETLVKNPLFAKGGTGGKAPEAAYDSLKGKGAYQAMRRDALDAIGSQWQRNPVGVQEFLDKYAPDLSNLADYIKANSGKGNQLPYALQEAAVAQAVRDAGHDAVLGYSKGKNGNFLSELFDVRESHYPDKFGGYRVFDGLLSRE